MVWNEVNDKTILLAESDPDDEFFTLRVFEKAGLKDRVVVARDGVEALKADRADEGRDVRSGRRSPKPRA